MQATDPTQTAPLTQEPTATTTSPGAEGGSGSAEALAADGATLASLQPLKEDGKALAGGLPLGSTPDLSLVMDIPVILSMEVGSTKIRIKQLLQLTQGSVVELDRFSGEPLDVKVNGILIAHGEVVVVNDKFGIRLTDVISAQERLAKLQ